MKQRIIILWILLLACSVAFGAELEVQSYVDRTTVGLDDYLKFTVEVTGSKANKASIPSLSGLKGFRNLGASTSSSSSYSVVNGKMTSSVSASTTFTLQPLATGEQILPPVSVQFKGKTYTTKPIRIKVKEGSTEPAPPVSQQMQQRGSTHQSSDKLADNMFIIADVSQNRCINLSPSR